MRKKRREGIKNEREVGLMQRKKEKKYKKKIVMKKRGKREELRILIVGIMMMGEDLIYLMFRDKIGDGLEIVIMGVI